MFQSLLFWVIVAATFTVYWLIPTRYRLGLLAIVSFGYIFHLTSKSALFLLGWCLVFYFATPLFKPNRKKSGVIAWGLILGILSFLLYFKYMPPIMEAIFRGADIGKILAPLGISYYTFKLIHYVVEVRRGNVTDFSIQTFFCYLFLFPIFTAGPIERFDHFQRNIEHKLSGDSVVSGLTRIMHGFIKKFFIGDVIIHSFFAGMNNELLVQNISTINTINLWKYLILMNLYLYMDFSAYSDLAIGTSRLFGIKIMENFNFPILAHNLQEFWRRWHMSLSGWCQNYIYMPVLGLTRNPHVALLATFIGMGLWHAGTLGRISWGVYHAAGITIYMTWVRFKKRRRIKPVKQWSWQSVPGIIITFLYVSGSMIFLVAGDKTFSMVNTLKILAKAIFIQL